LRKHLFLAAGAAVLLASGAASAQGLPFSSHHDTDQRWGVNRHEPRDMNVFHARADQQQPSGAAVSPDRTTNGN
jgi:hypothetical protein